MSSEAVPQVLFIVNVYVVVIFGFAIGLAMLVVLNPVAGDHKKDVPPEPLKVVELPLQMETSGPASAVAKFPTVILMASVDEPQVLETVTVYVIFTEGVQTGSAMFVALK